MIEKGSTEITNKEMIKKINNMTNMLNHLTLLLNITDLDHMITTDHNHMTIKEDNLWKATEATKVDQALQTATTTTETPPEILFIETQDKETIIEVTDLKAGKAIIQETEITLDLDMILETGIINQEIEIIQVKGEIKIIGQDLGKGSTTVTMATTEIDKGLQTGTG